MTNLTLLAQHVAELLNQHGLSLVTAESCTGGGVGYLLTSLPNSSAWYEGGFITYSNAAKQSMLAVASTTLDTFGAVSEPTARAMAEGALSHSKATLSIAITGIAGPGGGSTDKPVGTVWFAFASARFPTQASTCLFTGDRAQVREQAIEYALTHLLKILSSAPFHKPT